MCLFGYLARHMGAETNGRAVRGVELRIDGSSRTGDLEIGAAELVRDVRCVGPGRAAALVRDLAVSTVGMLEDS